MVFTWWLLLFVGCNNKDDSNPTPTPTREPTFDDLKQLIYTEATIKESLRLFTPAPLVDRMAAKVRNMSSCLTNKCPERENTVMTTLQFLVAMSYAYE